MLKNCPKDGGKLKPLGDLVSYKGPPHHSKFKLLDPQTNVLLTGAPNGILVRSDSSHVIVDYKTAKFTGTQDELYPIYEAQLNAYAVLGERLGFSPVSGLALIYMEPVTDGQAALEPRNQREDGFAMGFRANILNVPIQPGLVQTLLAKARNIYDLDRAPEGRPECKNSPLVREIPELASG